MNRIKMANFQKIWFLISCLGFFLFCIGSKWLLIQKYGSDIPYMDQWNGEATSIIIPWLENKFNFWESFWTAHNEHRIGWTRMWALFWVIANGQWDPLLITSLNAFVHLIGGILLMYIFRNFYVNKGQLFLPVVFLLVFSLPISWANTLHAFQIQVYLSMACAFLALYTLTNPSPSISALIIGIITSLAGIPCLSTAFATPLAVIVVKNLHAYKIRKWDKNYLVIITSCLVIFTLSLLSIHPTPGHIPLYAIGLDQFIIFFVKVCSIPFHKEIFLVQCFGVIIIHSPFICFVFFLLKSDGKSWESHDLTLLSLGAWLFLQTAAISYSRGNSELGIRHLDTFVLLIIVNAISLAYILQKYHGKHFKIVSRLSKAWIFLVCSGLVSLALTENKQNLKILPKKWVTMKTHLKTYLRENNSTKFYQIPLTELPFISHSFLHSCLDNEHLQSVLPVGLRKALPWTENKNIGFGKSPNSLFPIKGEFDATYYSTGMDNYYWESKEISTKSVLPILRIMCAGHPQTKPSNIYISSGQEKFPLLLNEFCGDKWQIGHLFIPQKYKSFKLVVECQSPQKWIAFQQPVELGYMSWFFYEIRKNVKLLLYLGLVVILISTYFLFTIKSTKYGYGKKNM